MSRRWYEESIDDLPPGENKLLIRIFYDNEPTEPDEAGRGSAVAAERRAPLPPAHDPDMYRQAAGLAADVDHRQVDARTPLSLTQALESGVAQAAAHRAARQQGDPTLWNDVRDVVLGLNIGAMNLGGDLSYGITALNGMTENMENRLYNSIAPTFGFPEKDAPDITPAMLPAIASGYAFNRASEAFSRESMRGREGGKPSEMNELAQMCGYRIPVGIVAGLAGPLGFAASGGMGAIAEGGRTYDNLLKQGATPEEAHSGFGKSALINLPIQTAASAFGDSALSRALIESVKSPLVDAIADVTSTRKQDGAPLTWEDVYQASPEVKIQLFKTLLDKGVPAGIAGALVP